MRFDLPDGASGYDACVFNQDGSFLMVGHHEECEQTAISLGALYCWIYRGRVIVRRNFEPELVNNECEQCGDEAATHELESGLVCRRCAQELLAFGALHND